MTNSGRVIVLAGLVLGAFLAGMVLFRPSKPDEALAQHQALLATLPHVDSVIAEHADSAKERIKLVYVGQDAAKRSALVAAAAVARADSLAAVATTVAEMRVAYDSLHRGYDSLTTALTVERKATTNALATSAFWQLAYVADSTQRTKEQADAVRLATRVTQLERPRCGRKCGIAIGVVGTVAAAWGVRQVLGR